MKHLYYIAILGGFLFTVNPAFAHLFTHQANPGQGGQSNHNDTHKFTSGAKAFAAQQKGK